MYEWTTGEGGIIYEWTTGEGGHLCKRLLRL